MSSEGGDERAGEVGGEPVVGVAASAAVAAAAAAAAAVTSDPAAAVILPSTYRNLTDRMYDKRKLGALEIEALIKGLVVAGNEVAVKRVIATLSQEFVSNSQGNFKKGGMIALAATAIALGPQLLHKHLAAISTPVLLCMHDPDPRVRYYALEAFYNVSKVSREGVLVMFTDVFDACCRLSADPDQGVRNANQLLDRLLKDIMTQQPGGLIDTDRFVALLRKRIDVTNPMTRHFLISWLMVLDSVPGIDLIRHLPLFFDGLFDYLVDPARDIASEASALFAELLKQISEKKSKVDHGQLVGILVNRCATKPLKSPEAGSPTSTAMSAVAAGHHPLGPGSASPANPAAPVASPPPLQTAPAAGAGAGAGAGVGAATALASQHSRSPALQPASADAIVMTALLWLDELAETASDEVLPFSATVLQAILPHLAGHSSELSSIALSVNGKLLRMAKVSTGPAVPVAGYVQATLKAINLADVPPRIAALTWLLLIHAKYSEQLFPQLDELFPALLKALSDPAEEVMRIDLEAIAQLSGKEAYFAKLMENLVRLFANERQVLRNRAPKIIRLLCRFADAGRIFSSLAGIIEKEQDVEFAAETVQTLNLLLLSSQEARMLRLRLQQMQSPALFEALYRAWALSPASLFSLCLLCRMYRHASDLVQKFSELEVTLGFLLELDQLVQLLESPAFVQLRLQLLEPAKNADLVKCLYGLLMILPQSTAFAQLKARLSCASKHALFQGLPRQQQQPSAEEKKAAPDFAKLTVHFEEVQKRRAAAEAQKYQKATPLPVFSPQLRQQESALPAAMSASTGHIRAKSEFPTSP